MRKVISFALLICLLLSTSTAFALDLSYVENNPDQYVISVNDTGDKAFISTLFKASQLAFSHKYDSEFYYSYTYSDIMVKRYGTEEAEPVWRLWLEYSTETKYQNFNSVTIELDGKSFTFKDISTPNSQQMKESSYREELCVFFGQGTEAFVDAIDEYVSTSLANRPLDMQEASTAKMILHGDEDIVIRLNFGSLIDLFMMINAHQKITGMTTLPESPTTEMIQNETPLLPATQFVAITNSSANIRSGPAASYDKIKTAVQGETFPLLGEDNGWYMIDVNGQTGFVSMKLSAIQ